MKRRNFVKKSIAAAIVAATPLALTGLVEAAGGGHPSTTQPNTTQPETTQTTEQVTIQECISAEYIRVKYQNPDSNKWYCEDATKCTDGIYRKSSAPSPTECTAQNTNNCNVQSVDMDDFINADVCVLLEQ